MIKKSDGHTRSFVVRVRPSASRTAVGGGYEGALGPALVVAVSEPAVDGRANQAALTALARALGLAKSQLTVRSGVRSRDKVIAVTDPPPDLAQRLTALHGL